ncbi:MAG: SRPBCC domain-containing protein, partial [Bacteroidota bacterium]
PIASNDMKIGGIYNARMEAKDGSFGFDLIATYSAIDLGNSFEYGFANRNVLVVFEEQNNQTKVTITFDPETENPIELQQQGWQAILDNFKSYVENK